MTRHKKGRQSFSADKKMEILKSHLVQKKPISEVSEQFSITPAMFYKWQADLFGNGELVFSTGKKIRPSSREEDLELENRKLRQKLETQNGVMLELMEEHVNLKKKLGVS